MTTKEVKLMIIENFIDHYCEENEKDVMKRCAQLYVDEDHVDEIAQAHETSRILIEVSGGNIQRILATESYTVILIDHDNIEAGDHPVVVTSPDEIVSKGEFYQAFCDESDPQIMEVRDELKKLHI